MSDRQTDKIHAATMAHGENFNFEFRQTGSDKWYRSPHLARPRGEAEALVARMNAADSSVEYRFVRWDGD